MLFLAWNGYSMLFHGMLFLVGSCTWSCCCNYTSLVADILPGLVVDVAPGEGNSAMSRQVQVSHSWPRQGDLVKPIAHDLLLYIGSM